MPSFSAGAASDLKKQEQHHPPHTEEEMQQAVQSQRITSGKNGGGDPLAFSEKKQEAFLGHILTDRLFFMQVRDYLKPEWFISMKARRLYALLMQFYERVAAFPQSQEELLSSQEFCLEDPRAQADIRVASTGCLAARLDFQAPLLIQEFGLWAQTVVFQEYVQKAVGTFNSRKPQEALAMYVEGHEKIRKLDFIGAEEVSWDLDALHKEILSDHENGITFGLPEMDKKLNKSAPDGALLSGDTTVIEAPSNIGKTTTLVTVIAHNLARGKRILYLTHEGRPSDIKFKVLCCLMQVTRDDYLQLYSSSEWFRRLANCWRQLIQERLVYVVLNRPFTTIQEVETIIRQKCEQFKLLHGRGFDLLVDDYPALLFTPGYLKGSVPKRINDEQVYGCFVSLALELHFHSLLAIQTNREGSRINRGQGLSQRLLTMEDVAESFGVMMKATNVITVNRSPYDVKNNRIVFYLCKSRSSETDWAFSCRSDFSKSTTHAPAGWPEIQLGDWRAEWAPPGPGENKSKYGCTAYRGTEGSNERLDALIQEYRDKGEVPEEAMERYENEYRSKGFKGTQK